MLPYAHCLAGYGFVGVLGGSQKKQPTFLSRSACLVRMFLRPKNFSFSKSMTGCLMSYNDAQRTVGASLQPATTDCSSLIIRLKYPLLLTTLAVWIDVSATQDEEKTSVLQWLCEIGTQGIKLTL